VRRRIGLGNDPRLSFDGTRVAFSRDEGERGRVVLVARTTGSPDPEEWYRAPPRTTFSEPDNAWFMLVGWLAGQRLLIQREDGVNVIARGRTTWRLLPGRMGQGGVTDVSISPAGHAVVFTVSTSSRSDVYVVDAHRSARPVRLTTDGHSSFPVYGPGGVAYAGRGDGKRAVINVAGDIWFLPAGASSAERLTDTNAGIVPVAFDATGDHLLAANPAMHNGRLWAVEMPGGRAWALSPWRGDLFAQALSRDGRTVLAAVGCGGTASPYGAVETLPFSGGSVRVIARGPCRASWTR
jgi:dipeptidyl aminopeptidase/acylaminoacyl peptidase